MSEFTEEPNSGKRPDEVAAGIEEDSWPADKTPQELPVEGDCKVEEEPMIEVHAPHESVHTWKDVFIHIGIVTVGLLLAIGLEQTVEYFHHRHQVAETREALKREREVNKRLFALLTEEQNRIVPLLQSNLVILAYLRQHPNAPESEWPGKFEWANMLPSFNTAAWEAAKSNNTISYMPQYELELNSQLYHRIDSLKEDESFLGEARRTISIIYYKHTGMKNLTPAEIDQIRDFTVGLIVDYLKIANAQRNFNRQFPDFAPVPNVTSVTSLTKVPISSNEQTDRTIDEVQRMLKIYELEYKSQ